jgi:hypothetical protein
MKELSKKTNKSNSIYRIHVVMPLYDFYIDLNVLDHNNMNDIYVIENILHFWFPKNNIVIIF